MRRYIGGVGSDWCIGLLAAAAEERSADEQKAIDAVLKLGGKVASGRERRPASL